MGRAYSLDLRERVVAAVAAGESCRAVAATFEVSVASVVKWSQRFRATGSAAAEPMGGNRPYVAGRRARLAAGAACREAGPDLAGAGWRNWRSAGSRSSYDAVWHFFEHEGISFKKKPARQRAGSPRRGPTAGAVEEVSGPA